MDVLFRILKSVKLTAAIIIYFVLGFAASTFISGFDFHSSIPFVIGMALFFINLLACTIYRFLKELDKKRRRNFAPDLVHVLLLLFIISAAMSGYLKADTYVRVYENDTVEVYEGFSIKANKLIKEEYGDGRPKDWTSQITVYENGEVKKSKYDLRVNHSLRLSDISIYQDSWGKNNAEEYTVIKVVKDPAYYLVISTLSMLTLSILFTAILFFRNKTLNNKKHKGEG